MPKISAPYGSWPSPIDADQLTQTGIGIYSMALDHDSCYWAEDRPAEEGRTVLVQRLPDGQTRDITPAGFNVCTRVHEYGGGALTVRDGLIVFSNFGDGRVYRQDNQNSAASAPPVPHPISPAGAYRYAAFEFDTSRQRVICVREDHSAAGKEAVNTLVAVDLNGAGQPQVLVSGNNFYSDPRLSPDGKQLLWLTWNHPNMPWDGTELWIATIGVDGKLYKRQQIAGGPEESIFQPSWSPDGTVYFVSDRTGWWNLYRWHETTASSEALCPMDAEFGRPQWVFGMSTYGFASASTIVCSYHQQGRDHLARIDLQSKTLTPIDLPYTGIFYVAVSGQQTLIGAGSPAKSYALMLLDIDANTFVTLKTITTFVLDSDYISVPQLIEFPTERGLTAFAWFYPPTNPLYEAPTGERPPLLVEVHGGPTGRCDTNFNLQYQYWTTRGYAILDVDYGGSAGYGRPYRERLNGQWGVVDVEDCVNAARYVADQGLADSKRLIIRGGSAGGYTVLNALARHNIFTAGCSYYGISDVELLVKETHKFEAHYCDRLIGPYPEAREVYIERSPLTHVAGISAQTLFFQGLDDHVVPPNQAETMVNALRTKGVPVAYVTFAGEGHCFRQAKNIKRALEVEQYFYARVFGFQLADSVEPVPIENLPVV